ncbi:TetR family transcriptional regulator [Herbihabitans rhizosphaerae]|uniref:TetR family transcriptional regulator n=1 Tax=Herbihabitans rhizosphaerae TaxID=1872711 RepID=A0A4Q7KD28_9PSEU|nr:TetR/AcrR family transcriptional regulator [Herbihabitans rhizosphaerae]RZS31458.1 TetR family transcriptional regulator [Herbihabitans rhizosphaerae]
MTVVKSRREQYSEATRAALLDTATALFAEHGFAATTLEDVARQTQVTRGAVYHHFANKSALFEAVFDREETSTISQIATRVAAEDNPWDAAMIGIDVFLERCCDPMYSRVIWQEGPIAFGWAKWKESEEKYAFGLIKQMIIALIDSGEIAPLPVDIATRLTFGMLGAAGMALHDAAEADKPRVKQECADAIKRMIGGMRVKR